MINFEGKRNVNKQIKQLPLNKLEKILPTDDINILLKNFTKNAEDYMTDIGSFKPIVEKFSNKMPVITIGDVTLKLSSTSNLNNSKERALEVVITTKSGEYKLEQTLVRGERKDILQYLKNEDFNENFKRFLMDCSDKFETRGLA